MNSAYFTYENHFITHRSAMCTIQFFMILLALSCNSSSKKKNDSRNSPATQATESTVLDNHNDQKIVYKSLLLNIPADTFSEPYIFNIEDSKENIQDLTQNKILDHFVLITTSAQGAALKPASHKPIGISYSLNYIVPLLLQNSIIGELWQGGTSRVAQLQSPKISQTEKTTIIGCDNEIESGQHLVYYLPETGNIRVLSDLDYVTNDQGFIGGKLSAIAFSSEDIIFACDADQNACPQGFSMESDGTWEFQAANDDSSLEHHIPFSTSVSSGFFEETMTLNIYQGSPIDASAPLLPTDADITVLDKTPHKVQLRWEKASDALVAQEKLRYQVRYVTSDKNLQTISDFSSFGKIAVDFTENLSQTWIQNLLGDTEYHINVLVVDDYGNQSIYNQLTVKTLPANSQEVDSSLALSLGDPNQKKTFYDDIYQRHWLFYYKDNKINYHSTQDYETWSQNGDLPYATDSFSVIHSQQGSAGNVFIVAEKGDGSIILHRGTTTSAGIQFDAGINVFSLSVGQETYYYPIISLDKDGYLWVFAAHRSNQAHSMAYDARGIRSTVQGHIAGLAWETAHSISSKGPYIVGLAATARSDGNMLLVVNGKDVRTYTGNVSNWHEQTDGYHPVSYTWPKNELGCCNALITSFQGDLILGKEVYQLEGNTKITNIAKWNGYSWNPLGHDLKGTPKVFYHYGSELYVGGEYYDTSGTYWGYLEKWDGTIWQTVIPEIKGYVSAIYIEGNDIYVGGNLQNMGDAADIDYFARWDGTAWHKVGASFNQLVDAIVKYGGKLYVAGNFTNAGGVAEADYLAIWDGTSWAAPGGVQGPNKRVTKIIEHDNKLIISGDFTSVNGNANGKRIAAWDGSSWSFFGSGFNNSVSRTIYYNDTLVALGKFTDAGGDTSADYIAQWDGATWSNIGGGALTEGWDAYVFDNKLYVTGHLIKVGGNASINRFATWDGTNWAPMGLGMPTTINALENYDSSLIIAGNYTHQGGYASFNNILKWDGESFSAFGDGLNNEVLTVLAHGNEFYAGGKFLDAGGIADADYLAKWNGSSWEAVAAGITGEISAIVMDANSHLYIGGNFTDLNGIAEADYIAKWDGASWSALETGLNNKVSALAVHNGALYVGGDFTDAGGIDNNDYIAKWDGSAWVDLNLILNNSVKSIMSKNDQLFIGGKFHAANSITGADALIMIDAEGIIHSLTESLSLGSSSTANNIFAHKDDICASGNFSDPYNLHATLLICWDGNHINSLGSSMFGQAIAGVSFQDKILLKDTSNFTFYTEALDSTYTKGMSLTALNEIEEFILGYSGSDGIHMKRYYGNTWTDKLSIGATYASKASTPQFVVNKSRNDLQLYWSEISGIYGCALNSQLECEDINFLVENDVLNFVADDLSYLYYSPIFYQKNKSDGQTKIQSKIFE